MTNYNNLPGVNIKVNDGQMLITEDNTTNSMLIIGITEPGTNSKIKIPDGIMFVPDEETLFKNYGKYITDGTLNPIAAEWKVAKENGVTNVFLLGVEGETGERTFKDILVELQDIIFKDLPDYEFSHIVVAGLYADQEARGLTASDFSEGLLEDVEGIRAYYTLEGLDAVTLPQTLSEGKDLTVTLGDVSATATLTEKKRTVFEYVKYAQEELQNAIDAKGIELDVVIELTEVQNYVQLRSSKKVEWSGAVLTEDFKVTLPISEEATLLGFGDLPSMLGHYAEKQILESGTVVVYIATSPAASTSRQDIREKVNYLTIKNNEFSKHVQVIAGPPVAERMPGSLRQHWMSGVTHYAVLVNSLPVQHAPTNQPLPGINNLFYDLSLKQLNELTGNKYVTFRSKNNRIVVVDGVTTAPDVKTTDKNVVVKSDFTRLTTLRSTSYMVSAIRGVVDPFIGRPNEFPVYNAMNTAIRGVINTAVEKGIIQDAAYSIELGDNLDVANIDLTILPQFELRKIDVTIGLSLPGGFEPMSQ